MIVRNLPAVYSWCVRTYEVPKKWGTLGPWVVGMGDPRNMLLPLVYNKFVLKVPLNTKQTNNPSPRVTLPNLLAPGQSVACLRIRRVAKILGTLRPTIIVMGRGENCKFLPAPV